ncbi:peroxide stress protein YaaA, partial [Amylibacter sp.]|nr:peroxide stress protein YaaA [Amylibacter sp.]
SDGAVINLASNEYFKAVGKNMKSRIITPSFKEDRSGELKMIGFFAKKARGAMARFMIKNNVQKPEDLKNFNTDGYNFQPELSDNDNWIFTRKTA